MNYTQLFTNIANLTNIPSTNADFISIFPAGIAYAEQRCYYDLDMVAANVRDGSASTVALNRNFNLPTSVGTFLVVDQLNVITPASTAPDSGTRNPLRQVSISVCDMWWPSTTGATVPTMWAYVTQDTYIAPTQSQIVLAPWPDTTYRVEVVGKIQPAALSASNPNTYLSDNLYSLMEAAMMVYMSGYMRNFGSQADNPQMAASWEGRYQELKGTADQWEARKKAAGASWTTKRVEPTAMAQRG